MFNPFHNKKAKTQTILETILKLQEQLTQCKEEVIKLVYTINNLTTKANRVYELGDTTLHSAYINRIALYMEKGNTLWKKAQSIESSIKEYKRAYKTSQRSPFIDDLECKFDKWELEDELNNLKKKVNV